MQAPLVTQARPRIARARYPVRQMAVRARRVQGFKARLRSRTPSCEAEGMAVFMLLPIVALVVGAVVWLVLGHKRAQRLSSRQRRELIEACEAMGIAPDHVAEVASRHDDAALIQLHRLEHRRRRMRTGVFR
jgi:hypothetical protein